MRYNLLAQIYQEMFLDDFIDRITQENKIRDIMKLIVESVVEEGNPIAMCASPFDD